MDSFRALIKCWPSRADLAADLAVTEFAVHKWWIRNSIPSKYWPALIAAARHRNLADITADQIIAIPPPPEPADSRPCDSEPPAADSPPEAA